MHIFRKIIKVIGLTMQLGTRDKGTAAAIAYDEPFSSQLIHCLPHGRAADLQTAAELSFRDDLVALLQFTGLYHHAKIRDQLLVDGNICGRGQMEGVFEKRSIHEITPCFVYLSTSIAKGERIVTKCMIQIKQIFLDKAGWIVYIKCIIQMKQINKS